MQDASRQAGSEPIGPGLAFTAKGYRNLTAPKTITYNGR